MRSIAIAALVGTVAATPATIFADGAPPHCEIDSSGRTVIHYTVAKHASFKCSHSGNTCSCVLHPTHHDGGCMQFDHNDGVTKTLKIQGDCSDTGKNHINGGWSGWGNCDSNGNKYRTCTNPAPFHNNFVNGAECTADGSSAVTTCPRNGGWGNFGNWGNCNSSGNKYRYRSCDNPTAINGGATCSGSTSDVTTCPRNGGWGNFGNWGGCNSSGNKYRYRSCNNPTAINGGAGCGSANSQSTTCPRNGGWGGFGGWGGCNRSCGWSGLKYRYRSCNNPTAINGGAGCGSANSQSTSCNRQTCNLCTGSRISWGHNFIRIGQWNIGQYEHHSTNGAGGHFIVNYQVGGNNRVNMIYRSDGHHFRQNTHHIRQHWNNKAPGVQFGDRFIQFGDFRICDVDTLHASIAHQNNHWGTSMIWRGDGTRHGGPRTDYQCRGRGVNNHHHNRPKIGDGYLQIGNWRLADGWHGTGYGNSGHLTMSSKPGNGHYSGNSAVVWRWDETIHATYGHWTCYGWAGCGSAGPTCTLYRERSTGTV